MELFKVFGSIFINNDEANKKIDETESKAKKIGDGFSNAGQKMTTAGTVMTGAVVGVGAGLIKMASDSDTANTKLQNQLGLSDKEAQKLKETGKNIYKSGWGESFTDITDALGNVKLNMSEVNDSDLENVTKSAMALAEIFDADLNEVTRGADQLMKAFGVSSDEAFDMLAKGAQNGLDFSGELFDNVAEYAPLWGEMGYEAGEMFGILERGSKEGVYNLDYMNDMMKEAQIRLKDGSKATGEAMEQMSKGTQKVWQDYLDGKATVQDVMSAVVPELSKMEDQTTANQIATDLFGTKWEDMGSKAVYAMLDTNEAMADSTGTMDDIISKQEDTFGTQFQELMRTSADALTPLATKLLELAEQFLPPLIEGVEKVVDFFSNLSPEMQTTILSITGLIAIIGPLLVVFGSIASAIGAIIPIVTSVMGVFTALGGVAGILGGAIAFITSPVTLVIAGIAALIAIGVLLYKNWDEVSAFLKKCWEGIKDIAVKVFNGIVDFLKEWGTTILAVISGPVGLIVLAITKNWDKIKEITSKAFDKVREFIETAMNKIKEVIDNVWGFIDKAWNTVLTKIEDLTGKNFDGLRDKIQTVMDTIKDTIDTVWNYVKETFQNVLDFLKALVTGDFEGMKDAVKNQMELIKETISRIWENIKTYIGTVLGAIKEVLTKAWDSIKEITEKVWNAIKDFFTKLWDDIKKYYETIWEGIKKVTTTVFDAIKKIVENIWNGIKKFFETTVDAIKIKITDVWNTIKTTTSTIFEGIKTTLSKIWDGIKTTIDNTVDGIKTKISDVWEGIKTTTKTVFDTVKGLITNPIETAKETVGKAIDKIKGFFTNLDLKFPSIKMPKLPKFTMTGSFGLNPPSVPKFGIDWFKTGGIATKATIAGIGEAGTEGIIPLEGSYMKPFATEMARQLVGVGGSFGNGGYQSANITVMLDGQVLARELGQPLVDEIKMRTGIR